MENVNVTDESIPTRDSKMDLKKLMHNRVDSTDNTKASPLDVATKNTEKGLVVNSDELKIKDEPLRDNIHTEERDKEYNDTVKELEETSDKAAAVAIIRKPTNQVEDVEMMDEIERSYFDGSGNIVVPEDAKYIRSKKDFGENASFKSIHGNNINEELQPVDNNTENSNANNTDTEKETIVQLLIDKTGYGSNEVINFTDEEQKVIDKASAIRLVEVEDKELNTMRVERDTENDLSFMETVDKYNMHISKHKVLFPLSGFRAEMTGLTFGEFSDISLDLESEDSDDIINFDKIWKMYSTIYNNMVNISCGKFKDFEDFLKKFSYFDVPNAIFGLLLSTQPEIDTISMDCLNKSCKTKYIHKYLVRTLLDYEKSSKEYLKSMEKINEASGHDLFKIAEESPTRSIKAIKLPSGVILEFGPISCYDYLYGILVKIRSLMKIADKIAHNDGEPVDGMTALDLEDKMSMLEYIQIVRGFRIPKDNGKWVLINTVDKVLEYLERYISIDDFNYVTSIYEKAMTEYNVSFSIKDVRCPKCGTFTKKIPVDIYTLVFHILQRMKNTNLILDNLHLF